MSDLFGNHIVGFPTRRLIYNTGMQLVMCKSFVMDPVIDILEIS